MDPRRRIAVPVVFYHVVEDLHLGHDAPGVDNEVAQELELGGDRSIWTPARVTSWASPSITRRRKASFLLGNLMRESGDGAYVGDDPFEAEGLVTCNVAADR